MSKTVITSSGNSVKSAFDTRFGRAAWLCVFDEETLEVTFIENEYLNVNHGAGTKIAEKMVELNVTKTISGHFGPTAKELLDKLNVQMVIFRDDAASIEQIIDTLKS